MLLPCSAQQEGENGHDLPAAPDVPHKAWRPGKPQPPDSSASRSRWRWHVPAALSLPASLPGFQQSLPKPCAKMLGTLITLKVCQAHPPPLQRGQREARGTGHQHQGGSQLLLPACLGQSEETPQDSKTRSDCTNLGSCCHRRCTGDI